MTLFISVLLLCTQACLCAVSKDDSTYELWRIDNLNNDDVLYEFEIRAHMTDEVWKYNDTIYFIVADYEQAHWRKLLSNFNVKWLILGRNLTGTFDDKFLKKYMSQDKGIQATTTKPDHKISTVVRRAKSEESEEILDEEYSYSTQRIHQLWSTEEVIEPHGPSELWRVVNVRAPAVLAEFNDRAHLTDEIWKRGNTIDFIVGKHETAYWRRFLSDNGIKFKILEHKVTGKINENFIKKYIDTRRGGDKSLQKKDTTAKDSHGSVTYSQRNETEYYEATTQMESGSSEEYSEKFDFAKMYGTSELWRADNVTSQKVLSEFNDRDILFTAHLTDEIWMVNHTIYFILGKHEAPYWSTLLKAHKIKFKTLEKSIKGKFDDKFIKKYLDIRRGSK